MYRVIVLYEQEPDAATYAEHVEVCKQVPSSVFRHGKITGAPMGEPAHKYYAEFEWPDKESFKQGVSSPEFMATGKDAMAMGKRMSVEFASIE